jgi:hypothetical protein
VVNTETIGTPQNDYVRYTTIDVTGKNAKKLDTSKVLNKWSKTAALNTGSANAAVPFFAQVMLGFEGGNLVPVANLPSASRAQLLQRLHRDVIFQTSFSNVKRQKVAGRAVYTYEVSVQPVAYAAFQKAFAQAIGMKTLDDVDPNAYQNQTAIKVELSVDARSHQLVSVNYPASKHVETYSSYGVPTEVALPGKTISSSQLQGLLSAL